jgi:hypothetical protein
MAIPHMTFWVRWTKKWCSRYNINNRSNTKTKWKNKRLSNTPVIWESLFAYFSKVLIEVQILFKLTHFILNKCWDKFWELFIFMLEMNLHNFRIILNKRLSNTPVIWELEWMEDYNYRTGWNWEMFSKYEYIQWPDALCTSNCHAEIPIVSLV